MYYAENLKGLLINTAKGVGLGFVASMVLVRITTGELLSVIPLILGLTIIIGSAISIFFCSRGNVQGYLSEGSSRIMNSVISAFFKGSFGGGIFIFIALIKMMIGVLIMIPIITYMAISYFFNLIYFTIMFFFEKNGKLKDKEELCNTLDKVAQIVPIVCVVGLCVVIGIAM